VQQIVRRRLNRVPDALRPLLKCAAVAGRLIDLNVLQRLAGAEVENLLTAGAEAGVFEIVEGHWRFAHDKLREAVLTDLSDDERRELHRAAALAIEGAYPGDESYHQVLMDHWRTAGEDTKELHYLVSVVRHLVLISADYERAIQLAERGLTLMGADDPERPALLNHLSRACESRADHAAARRWAEQARRMTEQRQDKPGLADSLRSFGIVADDEGDYPTAADYFRQSLAIARDIGDRLRISVNLNSLGVVAYHQGNFSATADYYQQSLAIAREIDNRARISVTLGNLGTLAHYQGDYASAIHYYHESLAMTREIGDRPGIAFGLNNLGLALLAQNDLPAAAAHLGEALRASYEIGMLALAMDTIVGLGRLHLWTNAAIYAAELAGLSEHHPATDSETRHGELATLKRELEAALPADELAAAMERGAQMDLDTVVKQLLAEQTPKGEDTA
jgi:tetratricopeptide (TPR) repeat protein